MHGWAVYYVLCITTNFIKWLMNLIKSGHAYVNLQAWFALLQATCLVWSQAHIFLVQKHFCLAHKSTVFCNNTLLSAIIQETGGPLREERAVDGKLKSRLEWPKR